MVNVADSASKYGCGTRGRSGSCSNGSRENGMRVTGSLDVIDQRYGQGRTFGEPAAHGSHPTLPRSRTCQTGDRMSPLIHQSY